MREYWYWTDCSQLLKLKSWNPPISSILNIEKWYSTGRSSKYSFNSHTHLKTTIKHSGCIISVRYSQNNYTILILIYKQPTLSLNLLKKHSGNVLLITMRSNMLAEVFLDTLKPSASVFFNVCKTPNIGCALLNRYSCVCYVYSLYYICHLLTKLQIHDFMVLFLNKWIVWISCCNELIHQAKQ